MNLTRLGEEIAALVGPVMLAILQINFLEHLGKVLAAGLDDLLAERGVGEKSIVEDGIFLDPLIWASESDWFWIGGEWGAAFIFGAFLGLGCMIGDCAVSFVKRRMGKKREGDESSKAPLLDTLPFAICTFTMGLLLFPNLIIGNPALITPMFGLLILTPVIHRLTNIFGYWVGLKAVPY